MTAAIAWHGRSRATATFGEQNLTVDQFEPGTWFWSVKGGLPGRAFGSCPTRRQAKAMAEAAAIRRAERALAVRPAA